MYLLYVCGEAIQSESGTSCALYCPKQTISFTILSQLNLFHTCIFHLKIH